MNPQDLLDRICDCARGGDQWYHTKTEMAKRLVIGLGLSVADLEDLRKPRSSAWEVSREYQALCWYFEPGATWADVGEKMGVGAGRARDLAAKSYEEICGYRIRWTDAEGSDP